MLTFTDLQGRTRTINNGADFTAAVKTQATDIARAEQTRAAIWESFTIHYNGSSKAMDQFRATFGTAQLEWFTAASLQCVEEYLAADDDHEMCSWEDLRLVWPAYDQVWKANHSAKKWCADKTGLAFGQSRLTMSKVLAGESYKVVVFPPKTAKDKKQITAAGKAAKGSAQGANIPTPESGATLLEQIDGDRSFAKAAVMQALKAFPEMAGDPDLQKAFQEAFDANQQRKAAKKSTKKSA
ncbi:MAG: hypothetical protein C0610_16725 [Desulfobacteraceae bacterium]|nr:MAG: hypothetical protein C0610_16725 [Desulfobacteraceae bacterium]